MERFVQRKSRCVSSYASFVVLCMGLCVVKVCDGAAADLSKCPTALTKLFPCLPYSQGTSQVPTKECCTNLETIHETEPQCLCELIAGSVNGAQGVPKINTTLSLQLGPACKVATKPSVCPDLLGLSPSDPLTKIFTAGSSTQNTSTTTTTPVAQGPSGTTAGPKAPPPENKASPHSFSLPATFMFALVAITLF